MLETLRKKSRTSNITRIIVSLIAVAGLLAVTKLAIFDVITGAAKLDVTNEPGVYSGKYVTIDADYILDEYVEHTTTTTRKYGGKTTTTNGYSYLALQMIPVYEEETYRLYFYSAYIDRDKRSSMNAKISEAWDYWSDDTGKVAPPEPVTITGTWTKMDAQMERYFREILADNGFAEESDDEHFYFYELDTKNIGGLNAPLFWVLNGVAAFFILFALFSIIGLFSSAYMKNIQKYLQKNSSVSLANIEEDFNQARPIGKTVWVGKKWTIYMVGNKANILTNGDQIWGYYYRRTGRYSVSEMRLYNKEKKLSSISLSEKETQDALKIYAVEQPQMVIGYTSDLEKTFNKNFSTFLELKYNPAMRGENQTEDFFRS